MPRRLLLRSQAIAVAPLAQLAEQRTLNPRVRGSSPWRRTRTDLGFNRSRSFLLILRGAGLRSSRGRPPLAAGTPARTADRLLGQHTRTADTRIRHCSSPATSHPRSVVCYSSQDAIRPAPRRGHANALRPANRCRGSPGNPAVKGKPGSARETGWCICLV
jgi:hypothetical protein